LLVESEGDMELALDVTVKLALRKDSNIELRFWRKNMADLFLTELMKEFTENDVPKDCNLDLDIYVMSNEDIDDEDEEEICG